jgi:ADP-heptose synthase, bifunctional sugar kinase/adenylyltransferase
MWLERQPFVPSLKPASLRAINKSFASIAKSLSDHRYPKLKRSLPPFEEYSGDRRNYFRRLRQRFLIDPTGFANRRRCALSRKIVAADPNPRNLVEWRGLTVIKPNRTEAFLAAGIPSAEPDIVASKDTDLKLTGETLLKKWEAENVLITLGEHGMMLFQKNEAPHYIPTKAREVFDVSGAGDTAIALFTLGLACGATPTEAAEIANHASAVVVSKLGTAIVTRDELMASFREESEGG